MAETNNSIVTLVKRTLANLDGNEGPHEVTHLLNSCLAIVVYVCERTKEGKIKGESISPKRFKLETCEDIKANLTTLRHALSHGNFHFNSNDGQISEIVFWNRNPKTNQLTDFAVVSVETFTKAVRAFADSILKDTGKAKFAHLPSDMGQAIDAHNKKLAVC